MQPRTCFERPQSADAKSRGMLNRAKKFARRMIGSQAKAILHGQWCPTLLPHHLVLSGGVSTLGGTIRPMPGDLLAALKLCDGTRTLTEVAEQSHVAAQRIVNEEENDLIVLWPERLKTEAYRGPLLTEGVILSPHLDDAALSMGSAMLRATESTPFLVIDVFSTVSWWRFDLSDGRLARIQTTRDAEEEKVMRLTHSRLRRWGFAEAPLRGYPLADIFTTERKVEALKTHNRIRGRVKDLAEEKSRERWFLPLGVGNHIDHRIARDAALDGLRDADVPAKAVYFYEDLPYAAMMPEIQEYSEHLTGVLSGARLEVSSRTPALPLKSRLLRFYYSQLTRRQIDSVQEYAERVDPYAPCERLWTFERKSLEQTEGKIPEVTRSPGIWPTEDDE
jgi:LmbE family N-acetylglucosaminyl deacetylase